MKCGGSASSTGGTTHPRGHLCSQNRGHSDWSAYVGTGRRPGQAAGNSGGGCDGNRGFPRGALRRRRSSVRRACSLVWRPHGRARPFRTLGHAKAAATELKFLGAENVSPRQEANVHRSRRRARSQVRQHATGAVRRRQRRACCSHAVFSSGPQLRGPCPQGSADGHRHRGAEPPRGRRNVGAPSSGAHEVQARVCRG